MADRPKRLFRLPWRSAQRIADEIEDEVAFHLDMREREMREGGLSAADARVAARDKFGDVADMTRYCQALDTRTERSRRIRDRLESLAFDLRYAARQLRRAPAFSLTAIITLALGIGANVAIMSVVYRLLLAPLPFPEGDRLVTVVRALIDNDLQVSATPQILSTLRERARSLEWVGGFESQEVAVGSGSAADAELLEGVRLEPELLNGLGLAPALGRGFLPEEAIPNGPPVAMLGHALWRSRYGGRPDVLNSSITIDGVPHTIVGVTARDFDVLSFGRWIGGQVWRPLAVDPESRGFTVLAKVRPGVTMEQAEREVAAIGETIERAATDSPFELRIGPAKSETSSETRQAVLLLLGAVTLVLLIACANVASLLLVRAAARDREIAVRIALGAGRGRLVRQLITESLLLALIGGGAGLIVAHYGLQLLLAVRPDSLLDLATVRLDPVVLSWCVTVSLACGLAFGLAPVLVDAHRADAALKGTRAASGTVRARRVRSLLVGAEVALSVTLLIGAGLMIQSVRSLQRQELGFRPANLVTAAVTLRGDRYSSPDARRAAYEQISDAVGRIPGVGARVIATGTPINTGARFGAIQVEGREASEAATLVSFVAAGPEYFRMLGMPLLEGSTFGSDTASVAIINRTMAQRLWPGEPAVGRRFRVGERGAYTTVTGVVADIRTPGRANGALELQMYTPMTGRWESARIVMDVDPRVGNLVPQLVRAIAEVDPTIPVRHVQTLQESMERGLAADRFNMRLLAGFACLALILSAVGLYGVIAYGVAQRTRELGMRIALGAEQRDVLTMVVRQGLRIAGAGVVVGFATAATATRAMRSMLYEVHPLDPMTFAAVGALIVTVAMVASWLPARRAARVDPIAALRTE